MIKDISPQNYNQIKDISILYYGTSALLEETCNITEDNGYIILQPWDIKWLNSICDAIEGKHEWCFYSTAMNIIKVTPTAMLRDNKINEILND